MKLVHSRWLGVVIVCLALNTVSAQLPVIRLSGVAPAGLQLGTSVELSVSGPSALDEADQLVFSHPGLKSTLIPGPPGPFSTEPVSQFGRFSVTADENVPPGVYEVFVKGRNGVSNPRALWVSSQPQRAALPQASADSPPALPLGTIWHDRYRDQLANRYALALAKGQKVRVSIFDTRIDSRAISMLRVASKSGKMLAESRSVGRFGAQVEFQAPEDGVVTIEAHDSIFRGGESYFYAIVAEDASAPSIDRPAARDLQQLLTSLNTKPYQVPITGDLEAAALPTAFELPLWIPALNVEAAKLPLSPPLLIGDEFPDGENSRSWDFDLPANKYWTVEVFGEQLGSLCDPFVEVVRVIESIDANDKASPSTGKTIKLEPMTSQDDASTIGSAPTRIVRSDPMVDFRTSAKGIYRVTLKDQLTGQRPKHGRMFLVSIKERRPTLSALGTWITPTNTAAQFAPIGNRLPRGARSAMRIVVDRRGGLSGPIEIEATNLPTGISCPKLTLGSNTSEGHLVFAASDEAPDYLGPIELVARSVEDRSVQARVQPATVLWEPTPTWNALVTRLAAQNQLCVSSQDSFPVVIQVGMDSPLEMARGGKLSLPVKLTRRAGGNDRVVMKVQNAPSKVTVGDITIEGKDSEAKPELTIGTDAPLGDCNLWFQCETKIKIRNNPEAFERAQKEKARLEALLADPKHQSDKAALEAAIKAITEKVNSLKEQTAEKESQVFLPSNLLSIRIVEAPFTLKTNSFSAKRGMPLEAAMELERKFEFEGAVDIKLVDKEKPAWLEFASEPVAEKATSTVLKLKVAPDAPVGDQSLSVKLTYKFHNQDLSITTPLKLRITE